jgi:hypothetical protein
MEERSWRLSTTVRPLDTLVRYFELPITSSFSDGFLPMMQINNGQEDEGGNIKKRTEKKETGKENKKKKPTKPRKKKTEELGPTKITKNLKYQEKAHSLSRKNNWVVSPSELNDEDEASKIELNQTWPEKKKDLQREMDDEMRNWEKKQKVKV